MLDKVTPFEYGAPGLSESRKDKIVQYEHNPYFVTGPAGAIVPSARFMNLPSHYPNSSTENALYNSTPEPHYGPSHTMYCVVLPPGPVVSAIMRMPSSTSTDSSRPCLAKEGEAMT